MYSSLVNIDEEAAADFIFFLVAICCSDGDACWRERSWLKKIYK